jgi:hypothetical protein
MIVDTGVLGADQVKPLLSEANELVAIFAASRITAQRGRGNLEENLA